jgi:hypothetical protein
MVIIHGMYNFRPKRLAFRNDFCLSCGRPRRSVRIRTFDMWHIFWIPILPLGFWKRWICTACGRQPHVSTKTRPFFIWVGLSILLILSAAVWAMPIDRDFVTGIWILRVGAPLGAILVFVHLLHMPKGPSLRERLATIRPASDTVCPFCGVQLLTLASQCSCPVCGVVRL